MKIGNLWKKHLLLTTLFFSQLAFPFGVATLEEAEEYGVSIVAGSYHTCSIDANGVKCWGDNRWGQSNVPPLQNPKNVTAAGHHTCALDDSGVKCWGAFLLGGFSKEKNDIPFPTLQHPKQIATGSWHACAIDDSGVKCWGNNHDNQASVPPYSEGARQVAVGDHHTCILIGENVRCWGWGGHGQTKVPPLKKPSYITAGNYNTCAIDDDGVKCWGQSGEISQALHHPQKITASESSYTCALDDTGMHCWGSPFMVPPIHELPLENPLMVVAGEKHLCAVDNLGVRCWNSAGEESPVPEELGEKTHFVPERLFIHAPAKYLENIVKDFPSNKAEFLRQSAKIAESIRIEKDSPPAKSYRNYLHLLTLYEFLSPVIEGTTSPLVQEKICPKYTDAVAKLRKSVGVDSFKEIYLFPENAGLALSLSSIALRASSRYLADPSSRNDLEVMVQELGLVAAKLQGQMKLKDGDVSQVNVIYHSHQPLIQLLVESEKTRAFGMVLTKAQSYFEAQ